MARILQAVTAYGPKLELNQTVQLDQVAEWMASRTGLNKSEVMMVLQELHEGIIFFNRQGTPVKLPGVGIFTPSINRSGKVSVNFRADAALKKALSNVEQYQGRMKNKKNIGLTNQEYKTLWDAEHPTDPLII